MFPKKIFCPTICFLVLQAQLLISILLGLLLLTFCLEKAEGFYTRALPGVRNGNYSLAASVHLSRSRGQHEVDQQHARLSRDVDSDDEEYGLGFLPPLGRYKVEEKGGSGAYSLREVDFIADSYSAVAQGIGFSATSAKLLSKRLSFDFVT